MPKPLEGRAGRQTCCLILKKPSSRSYTFLSVTKPPHRCSERKENYPRKPNAPSPARRRETTAAQHEPRAPLSSPTLRPKLPFPDPEQPWHHYQTPQLQPHPVLWTSPIKPQLSPEPCSSAFTPSPTPPHPSPCCCPTGAPQPPAPPPQALAPTSPSAVHPPVLLLRHPQPLPLSTPHSTATTPGPQLAPSPRGPPPNPTGPSPAP